MQKPRLVSFDMDGTLTDTSSWFVLNSGLGMTGEEDLALYKQYYEQKITYGEWMTALFTHWKQKGEVTKERMQSFFPALVIKKDAKEVLMQLREKGLVIVMNTGAPFLFAEFVAKQLGITHILANVQFTFDEHGVLRSIDHLHAEEYNKVVLLESLIKELGLAWEDVAHVGDSDNDRVVFEKVGKPILFGDKELSDRADAIRIHTLSELLDILL